MINDWKQVTLDKYKQITAICDGVPDDYEATVKLVAILNDDTPENVWNYPMRKMNELTNQLTFLREFPELKARKYKQLNIGGWRLAADTKLKDFTVAQYLDFQSVWQAEEKDLARLIAIFYLPEGKKYNDGYDVAQLISEIEQNIDVVTANEIAFFLCRRWLRSTRYIRVYLSLLARRTAKKILRLKKG